MKKTQEPLVLFLSDNGINESLPMTDVSALLRSHGFQTDLLIERDEGNRFLPQIEQLDPFAIVVAFDVMGERWPTDLTRLLKKRRPRVPVLAVGTYATLNPEIIERLDVDALCRGEAEHAVLEMMCCLRDDKDYTNVQNLWVKKDDTIVKNPLRPLLSDLDSLPIPHRELYYRRYSYLRHFSTKRIVCGRGCANRCAYCYNAGLQNLYEVRGRRFTRKKSPGRLMMEIEDLRGRSTVGALYFIDDLFTDDGDWLEDFCSHYHQHFTIPFSCNITADSVDERKVRALAAAGCRAVLMGVETGSEHLRMKMLKKPIRNEQVIEAVKLFRRHGLKFLAYNMLGVPGESNDDLMLTVKFNQQLRPDFLRFTVAFPMPNTAMVEQAVQKNMVTRERLNQVYKLPPKEQYKTCIYQNDPDQARRVDRMFYLFPLAVKWRLSRSLTEKLLGINSLYPFLKLLHFFMVLWEEKHVFHISWISGLRMFLHTGHPLNKTKNANNFIP